jgi:hypothetical protein
VKLIRSPSKTQLLCNSNECNKMTEIWALVHSALTWLLYPTGRALRVDDKSCLSSTRNTFRGRMGFCATKSCPLGSTGILNIYRGPFLSGLNRC